MTGTLHKVSRYQRQPDEWYVDEPWVSDMLLGWVARTGAIDLGPQLCDPCCGRGTIPVVARGRGYQVLAMDLRDRGLTRLDRVGDFHHLAALPTGWDCDFVFNPPYGKAVAAMDFIRHALTLTRRYVCAVVTESFVGSIDRYPAFTNDLPLAWLLVCSDRPSMPPGGQGIDPKGGQVNYHWHIYDRLQPPGTPFRGWWLCKGDAR
jgi:hypothetical protein